jgi:hypothetical protein
MISALLNVRGEKKSKKALSIYKRRLFVKIYSPNKILPCKCIPCLVTSSFLFHTMTGLDRRCYNFLFLFLLLQIKWIPARARSLSISFLCMFCVSPSCGRCQKEPLAWKILPSTKCFALHLTFAHTSCEPLLLFIGCNPLSTKQMLTRCYCVCVAVLHDKGRKESLGCKTCVRHSGPLNLTRIFCHKSGTKTTA